MKRTDIAWALINAGADLTAIDRKRHNAVACCLYSSAYEMAEKLLDDKMRAGLDIHAKNSDGLTLLTTAVSRALFEKAKGNHPLLNIVRKLVRAGADVNDALGIAQMHKADAQRGDPMGFFDRHITDVIDILTSR